jgi:hypothetical protein
MFGGGGEGKRCFFEKKTQKTRFPEMQADPAM